MRFTSSVRFTSSIGMAILLASSAIAQTPSSTPASWKEQSRANPVSNETVKLFTITGTSPEGETVAELMVSCKDGKLDRAGIAYKQMVQDGQVLENLDGVVSRVVFVKMNSPTILYMNADEAGQILRSRIVKIGALSYVHSNQISATFEIPDPAPIRAACSKTKQIAQ